LAKLSDKIKTALDESRMLILGAQVFLGFQFRVVFEPAFERLPRSSQYLKLAGLATILVGLALLMSPGSYHRIVRGGSDAADVHRFTSRAMDVALIPFILTLGIDLYVTTGRVLGTAAGITAGAVTGGVAFFFWYGLGFLLKRSGEKTKGEQEASMKAQPTTLKDKIDQALTEARMVLPGAQALLGFQLVTMLMDGFDKLPSSSKYIHIISLSLIALSTILLMTPAAFHRIAEGGEDTERFHRVASTLLLLAMIPLPLGICGDIYVVFLKVTESSGFSLTAALLLLGFFYGLWFGFTAYRRARLSQLA
jgi:hypothetical protein